MVDNRAGFYPRPATWIAGEARHKSHTAKNDFRTPWGPSHIAHRTSHIAYHISHIAYHISHIATYTSEWK